MWTGNPLYVSFLLAVLLGFAMDVRGHLSFCCGTVTCPDMNLRLVMNAKFIRFEEDKPLETVIPDDSKIDITCGNHGKKHHRYKIVVSWPNNAVPSDKEEQKTSPIPVDDESALRANGENTSGKELKSSGRFVPKDKVHNLLEVVENDVEDTDFMSNNEAPEATIKLRRPPVDLVGHDTSGKNYVTKMNLTGGFDLEIETVFTGVTGILLDSTTASTTERETVSTTGQGEVDFDISADFGKDGDPYGSTVSVLESETGPTEGISDFSTDVVTQTETVSERLDEDYGLGYFTESGTTFTGPTEAPGSIAVESIFGFETVFTSSSEAPFDSSTLITSERVTVTTSSTDPSFDSSTLSASEHETLLTDITEIKSSSSTVSQIVSKKFRNGACDFSTSSESEGETASEESQEALFDSTEALRESDTVSTEGTEQTATFTTDLKIDNSQASTEQTSLTTESSTATDNLSTLPFLLKVFYLPKEYSTTMIYETPDPTNAFELTTTEDTFAFTEDNYPTTEPVFSITEDTLATTEDIFAITEDTLATTEDSFAITEDTFVTTEDIFAITEDTFATTEDSIAITEDIFATTEDSSSNTDSKLHSVSSITTSLTQGVSTNNPLEMTETSGNIISTQLASVTDTISAFQSTTVLPSETVFETVSDEVSTTDFQYVTQNYSTSDLFVNARSDLKHKNSSTSLPPEIKDKGSFTDVVVQERIDLAHFNENSINATGRTIAEDSEELGWAIGNESEVSSRTIALDESVDQEQCCKNRSSTNNTHSVASNASCLCKNVTDCSHSPCRDDIEDPLQNKFTMTLARTETGFYFSEVSIIFQSVGEKAGSQKTIIRNLTLFPGPLDHTHTCRNTTLQINDTMYLLLTEFELAAFFHPPKDCHFFKAKTDCTDRDKDASGNRFCRNAEKVVIAIASTAGALVLVGFILYVVRIYCHPRRNQVVCP